MAEPDGTIGDLAHLVREGAGWRSHALAAHLRDTGTLAASFAASFGSDDWAQLAGLWHDLGKHRAAFQRYLRAANGLGPDALASHRVDHSTAGAIHAIDRLGVPGRLLAYPIAGHHAGLTDWFPGDTAGAALSVRLRQTELLSEATASTSIAADVLDPPAPTSPPPTKGSASEAEGLHLWVRMLFSCLVDADFLDTERFFDPRRAAQRQRWPSLASLRDSLARHQDSMKSRYALDDLRVRVREEVMAKAALEPGFFSLTVPTGGGKTLTSLRFAFDHALAHGHARVVYAIPYLSIIEQTADVFRGILGDGFIEHHSSLDPDERDQRARAAAENWDAPLVVTTVVQLFESLFAARGSRCRKLHNLARSVIVLDEAQLLPSDFLAPILGALRALVDGYGVSVVLCTATQPALASRASFGRSFRGLDDVRELVDDPAVLFDELERVTVSWPADPSIPTTWEAVAGWLGGERAALCVVNSRADARSLAMLMVDDGELVHLSALMCAEHRSRVIGGIRERLARGDPIRVVSTQLIEAGVDIDFPVVYRALAGLDSVAQSAGRCNREGLLPGKGRVVVFVPPKPPPMGHLRRTEQATRSLLDVVPEDGRMRPSAFTRYFELLYETAPLDRRGIVPLLTDGARRIEFAFRTASQRFQLIDDAGTATVLVPYGRGADLLRRLRGSLASTEGPDRRLLRSMQRFTVTVHRQHLAALLDAAAVSEVMPDVYALDSPGFYDERFGLLVSGSPVDLVI